jgi:hypothetical protein
LSDTGLGDADLTRRRQLPLLSSAVVAFKRGGLEGTSPAALVFGKVPQAPAWRTSRRPEWIVEAPTDSATDIVYPLADYTPTGFTGMGITGAQTSLDEIVMVQNGVQVSTPSALVSGAFNIAYGDIAPAAP